MAPRTQNTELRVSSDRAICFRCGKIYPKFTGNFPTSYAAMYKGIGHLPCCKECFNAIFNDLLVEYGDVKEAIHQMCRKLDLYWNEDFCDQTLARNTPRTAMSRYLARINGGNYAGKSYDDSLNEARQKALDEGKNIKTVTAAQLDVTEESDDDWEVPDDVVAFWGPGYTPSMYKEAEQRRQYWMSRMPDEIDIGTEAIIRQICLLELDINRDRAEGKSVDKSINALNNLLGSANLKPIQKKDDGDAKLSQMPLGVGIQEWEKWRPLPETPEEQKDAYHRVKDIMTWFVGHFAAMTGVHNTYSKAYEEEMDRLRVKLPEIADEDDNTFLDNIFGGGESS